MTSLADPSEPSELVSEYHSFLVRLWREHAHAPWRASVQSVQTGTILHFPDLTRLFAFLQEQTVDELIHPTDAVQLTGNAGHPTDNTLLE